MPRENYHDFTPEGKEKEPQIDWVKIFNTKLATLEPLREQDESAVWRFDLAGGGIISVKREGIVLLFYPESRRKVYDLSYDLWLENPKDIKSKDFIHNEAADNLQEFLKQYQDKVATVLSGFFVQDQNGDNYLLLDTTIAEVIERFITDEFYDNKKSYIDLMEKYNLKKIIGRFSVKKRYKIEGGREGTQYTIETREMLGQELIGKIREENHLRAFIEEHKDELNTNNKVLRFRLLAQAAREAAKTQGQPYSLEQVLKDSLD